MSQSVAALVERSKYVSPNRLIGSDPAAIAKAYQAVALLEEGLPLKDALDRCDLKRATFSAALSSERELALKYARARETSADFLVDEALDVVRNEENQLKARNIADMCRWAAGKFNSKRYGDRIDLNVTQTLDISGTLLEARQRTLRPVSDQQDVIDVQAIDSQGQIEHTRSDNKSESAEQADIFSAPTRENQAPPGDEVDIFS